jgi:hypothetical protein
VGDILEFPDVIGDATKIPQDGRIDLCFHKAYLESCEDADAKREFKSIRNYVEELHNTPARFSIMDFSFPSTQPQGDEKISCRESST